MATKKFNLRNPLPPKGKPAAKACCETPYMARTILGFNDTTPPSPPQPSGQFQVDGAIFTGVIVIATNATDFIIDWGDGSSETQTGDGNPNTYNHTYGTADIFIITISGVALEVINFDVGTRDQLLQVDNLPSNLQAFAFAEQEVTGLPALPNTLSGIIATDNPFVLMPVLPGPMLTLFATTCELSIAEVDGILARLDTNGQTGGTVNLSGQTPPAPPGVLGAAAAASLILKAWTVATD